MALFYLLPAALAWASYGVAWILGAPGWVEMILFGGACASSGFSAVIVILAGAGSRR